MHIIATLLILFPDNAGSGRVLYNQALSLRLEDTTNINHCKGSVLFLSGKREVTNQLVG